MPPVLGILVLFQLLVLPNIFADEDIGDSLGWHQAADTLRNITNQQINPCYDFYEFACGKMTEKLKGAISDARFLDAATEAVSEVMREAFESDAFSPSEAINKAKSLYKSCMDISFRNDSRELVEEVKEFGGWPLIEGGAWNASNFDLTKLLAENEFTRDIRILQPRGNDVFFKIVPNKHITKGTWSITFTKGTLSVPSESILLEPEEPANAPILLARRKELNKIIRIVAAQAGLNVSEKENRIKNEIDEIFAFETKLAKSFVLQLSEDNEKFTNLRKSFAAALENNPDDVEVDDTIAANLTMFNKLLAGVVNWEQFFEALVTPARLELMKKEKLVRIDVNNFLQIVSALSLIKFTDPRVVQNYVVYRFLKRNKVVQAYGKETTRRAVCIGDVTEKMRYATSAIYVQNGFSETSRPIGEAMAEDLRQAFDELLVENDWLDNKTRTEARKKLKEMVFIIASPEISNNIQLLDEYYKELKLEFTKPYLTLSREVTTWKNRRLYEKPLERGGLNAPITEVNAQHLKTLNQLVIHAAILQRPAFNETFPMSLNYGGAGTIIGHEITHGFDYYGADYDSEGNYRNWWQDKAGEVFEEKTAELIDQYDKITGQGTKVKLNGEETLSENIADLGGIREAFRAYQNYVKKNGPEKRLPGDFRGYTHEQLFFIGFAMPWCGYMDPAAMSNRIATDEHTPDRHRVNEALKDTEEFAEAYNCPLGMPMNPEKKIRIWRL